MGSVSETDAQRRILQAHHNDGYQRGLAEGRENLEQERMDHEVTRRRLDAAFALIEDAIDWFGRISSADGSGHSDLGERLRERHDALRQLAKGGGDAQS